MHFRSLLLLAVAASAILGAPAVEAGPNVPLCLAIQNNYNACIQQQSRYGGGYGYGRGHGGGWGGDAYGYRRQQRRAQHAQAACAPWIVQLKANRCF